MNILITAGNTHAPVDRLKILTNVFTGTTGANLARTAYARGHRITILTSQPYTLYDIPDPSSDSERRVAVLTYHTFDELATQLQQEIRTNQYDCVIHAAAVSDYLSAGVFAPDAGTHFNARSKQWERRDGPPRMTEQKDGKLDTAEPEVWLRLVRAPKLIDRFRSTWGYGGFLVNFIMEVGRTDQALIESAEQSRSRTGSDLIVANTLEISTHLAYIGPIQGQYECVPRRELAERLMLTIEDLQRNRSQ